jgi:membrane associated rhomboid family serine protease
VNPLVSLVSLIERRNPNLALVLLSLNLIGFVWSMLISEWLPEYAIHNSATGPSYPGLIAAGALVPGMVIRGEWFRLVTPIFLHVDLLHLAANSWAIYALFPHAQTAIGTARSIGLYLVGGIVASLTSLTWKCIQAPDLDLETTISLLPPAAGASGAVFAIFGLLLGLVWSRRDASGTAVRNQLVFWLLINVVIGLSVPVIDNAAHFGGFVTGLLIARLDQTKHLRLLRSFLASRTLAGACLVIVAAAFIHLAVWVGGRPGQEYRELLAVQGILIDSQSLLQEGFEGKTARKEARNLIAALDEVEGGESGRALRGFLELPLTEFKDQATRRREEMEKIEVFYALLDRMVVRLGPMAPFVRSK